MRVDEERREAKSRSMSVDIFAYRMSVERSHLVYFFWFGYHYAIGAWGGILLV